VGEAELQCTKAFFPLLKLSLFQDLTRLGGSLKTASGKESFCSSYKGALAGAHPSVAQRVEMQLSDLPWGPKST
jgi:hypothetical protein